MDVLIVFAAVLFASSLSGTVHAYLDPGTGSMAIQMVLAGVVGVLTAIKLYWTRLRAFFLKTTPAKRSLLD